MLILPAIDLKNGQCVRLRQGLADQATVYSSDPARVAQDWQDQGATYLHVIDLDGAFSGKPVHLDLLRRIVDSIGIPVQTGGGFRTLNDIQDALRAGAARVIVGTKALSGKDFLAQLVQNFGHRVAVGIDARNGLVQVNGWVETTAMAATDLAAEAAAAGIKTIIFTDTARDGMLQGVNVAAMDAVCSAAPCDIIASGGISTPADITALLRLNRANLTAAIVGKALYEGSTTIRELIQATRIQPRRTDACP